MKFKFDYTKNVLTLTGNVEQPIRSNNSTVTAFKRTFSPLEIGMPIPPTYNDDYDKELLDDELDMMENTNEFKYEETKSN